MESLVLGELPTQCPSCQDTLAVTRLTCPTCGTEVNGVFTLSRLAALHEPHASLLELFLRVRGNVQDMRKILGLSYPTVKARLEEALTAAGLDQEPAPGLSEVELSAKRTAILDGLEHGEITVPEAAARLRGLQRGKPA
jgi:hypothetical protein